MNDDAVSGQTGGGGIGQTLYESLRSVCAEVPSRGYVECLLRMAALLHDVGHGPFGHFFDHHYLADYGLTHETLGAHIIRQELADLLRRIRGIRKKIAQDLGFLVPAVHIRDNLELRPNAYRITLKGVEVGLWSINRFQSA